MDKSQSTINMFNGLKFLFISLSLLTSGGGVPGPVANPDIKRKSREVYLPYHPNYMDMLNVKSKFYYD